MQAQEKQLQLIPEFSIGQPVGAFSEDTFNTKNGLGGGLHLEKQNIWKVFGLGLYAGYHSYETDFSTPFPSQINDPSFASSILTQGDNFNWKSLQLAIGPIINFNLSKKLQLQGFTKVGLAKITYPEYQYFAEVTNPTNQEFTLFEANTASEIQSNFNFMMFSGLRVNYSISKRIGLSLGVNYLHIKGLTHTYTTRNVAFTGSESSTELFNILLDSEETTKTYECNINSINGTIGVIINMGAGTPNEDPVNDEPDIPIKSNLPEENYNCQAIIYQSPGYNTPVVLDKKPYVIFEWTDENASSVKEDKSYQLLFFIKEKDTYKEVDKRIMNSKRRFWVGLNPNKPYPNNELFWQIVPVDDNKNEFCPEPSKLMRLLVFKNKEEAVEKLPSCLVEPKGDNTLDTDVFRKKN